MSGIIPVNASQYAELVAIVPYVAVSIAAICAILAYGIAVEIIYKDSSRAFELSVNRELSRRSATLNRNLAPHGGKDEKSDPTPTKPKQRHS